MWLTHSDSNLGSLHWLYASRHSSHLQKVVTHAACVSLPKHATFHVRITAKSLTRVELTTVLATITGVDNLCVLH